MASFVTTVPTLHVDQVGNPDGPPIGLIHGFMSSNLQWRPNTERLREALRMFLIEHPGHGQSPIPADPAGYEPTAVLPAIDRVREQLGLEKWWIGGHSMGGAMALRYALAYPERVSGVVFTNSRAVFGTGAAARPEPKLITDLRSLPYHPIHAKRFGEDLKADMIAAADAMSPEAVRNVIRAVGEWASAGDLHRLQVPALLVNGRWEKAFQPHVADVQEAIDDVTVVTLDGGHSINIENAEGFNRAVLDFVKGG